MPAKIRYMQPHTVDRENLNPTDDGCEFTPLPNGKRLSAGFIRMTDDKNVVHTYRLFFQLDGKLIASAVRRQADPAVESEES